VKRAVVAGGGTMGAGIAAALLAAGDSVALVEASSELAEQARARVDAALEHMRRRGKLDEEAVAAAAGRLVVVDDVAAVDPAPAVAIEAVPERPELKQTVLRALETLTPALLGSNTSSLSIDGLARAVTRPERLLGLHFFNPVPAMDLVEVVVGARTGEEERDAAVALARRLGKEPIVVRDKPGFATSRLGVALGLEAIRMVEDDVAAPESIDRALELGYRHPVGPLRLTDIVGLDVRLDIARNLEQAYGARFAPPALLVEMVERGQLGKKSGEGFYRWDRSS
jgi:3-hydroxybutyryl-CoA dehydrogenase